MDIKGFIEIGVTLGLTILLAFPLGLYLARVWEGKSTWLDLLLRPVEKLSYALLGVKADKGQDWKAYGGALIGFSFVSFAVLYLMLRYQNLLPWNPQNLPGLSGHLAFNTAISFTTNTNWQSYVPEATMSTFSQMAGLTFHNFVSAAAGIAVAAAVARAFIADRKSDLGNFFVDLIRITLYVLLPISIVLALVFVALGVPQSMHAGFSAVTLEGAKQQIPLYPVASQEAIKMFGTNGGGVFNANSAHPFENPSPLTNLIQMIAMNVLGFACVIAFGKVVGVGREARALVIVMLTLVGVGALCIYASESVTPATLAHLGVTGGNFEGKETRFGLAASSVFSAMTTGASCGAVNGMHGSFMPLSGGVALFLMQIGEIAPGGVGSGLYGMIVMALLSVFVAGLMVGRTPEYLGKKVEVREVKAAMLAVLILPFAILSFSAVAAVLPEALKGLGNTGARGLTEVFYAYTSAAANNGSAFAGLTANAPWWDVTLAIGMLLGRFGYVIPVLYIAGALAAKPKLAPTAGTLPAHGGLFVGLLIGVILILGGLQFFPTLALTSILEHFQMITAH